MKKTNAIGTCEHIHPPERRANKFFSFSPLNLCLPIWSLLMAFIFLAVRSCRVGPGRLTKCEISYIALPKNPVPSSDSVLLDKPCFLQERRLSLAMYRAYLTLSCHSVAWQRQLMVTIFHLHESKIMTSMDTSDIWLTLISIMPPSLMPGIHWWGLGNLLMAFAPSGMCQLLCEGRKKMQIQFSNSIMSVCEGAGRLTPSRITFYIYFTPSQACAP